MRWRQFFTPVESLDAAKAGAMMADRSSQDLLVLDVRQPKEYAAGHIPGAKLVPLPELVDRLAEMDPARPTLVYCAVGGRSRVAAQILSGKGFATVFNLSGGFKAWRQKAAYGQEDSGLALFSGDESPESALAVAYSLEDGLRDFYLSMAPKVANADAKALFRKLAEIEVKHQDRIYDLYAGSVGAPLSREAFVSKTVAGIVEGGLTTEAYVSRFSPDPDSPADIVELAMSIEAQALDLCTRTAWKSADDRSRNAFLRIAEEEKAHLKQLGQLMDELA